MNSAKQYINSTKQCVNSEPMWGYCSRTETKKKKKKKKEAENMDVENAVCKLSQRDHPKGKCHLQNEVFCFVCVCIYVLIDWFAHPACIFPPVISWVFLAIVKVNTLGNPLIMACQCCWKTYPRSSVLHVVWKSFPLLRRKLLLYPPIKSKYNSLVHHKDLEYYLQILTNFCCPIRTVVLHPWCF